MRIRDIRAGAFGSAAARSASVAVVLAVGLSGPAATQTAPRASLELDGTEIRVGDRLDGTIVVEHAAGQTVVWPDSLDIGPFEVLSFSAGPPRRDGDRAVSTATLTVTAFELGELDLPPIELTLRDTGGEETTVSTDPFAVGVVSVGLDEGADIRDVKGPRGIARDWLALWPWALLAAILGALAWRALSRRGRGGRQVEVREVQVRAPGEIALEELDRLEAGPLLERGEVKEFHIEISAIVRTYIERRFGVEALEMTTGELLDALERPVDRDRGVGRPPDAVPDALRDELRVFLVRCDLVKFAKRRPSADESRELFPSARRFVRGTAPGVPRPAAAPESTAGEHAESDSGSGTEAA
ncbi:MAG: hypothetical protein R3195_01580 [Gemmatimonadota bacterium]|nr:hypothetical protein [Gemmatimonadota bacterium]